LSWRNPLKIDIIDVAPLPILAALRGLNDWMLCSGEMRAGVTVGRRVAATDVSALEAHAQVHPLAADFEAVFATLAARLHLLHVFRNMLAS